MRRLIWQLCSGTVATMLAAPPATAQGASGAPERIAGCYAVELGPWSGSFPSGSPASHQPPPNIRLDTARFTGRFSAGAAYLQLEPPIAIPGRQRMSLGRWRVAGDSVFLLWSDGFSGVSLSLGLRADSLRGVAYPLYDVIGPVQPTASVLIRRAACAPSSREAAG